MAEARNPARGWERAWAWVRARRANRFAAAVVATALVAGSVCFFVGSDARGRTARLTADAWYYHAYLPSLVFDRDVNFSDEYQITHNWYRLGKTQLGKPANVFGIGPAVFEMPWFLAGHVAARLVGSHANGFSRAEVETTLYASLLFSLGALIFAMRLVRRRLGGGALAALAPLFVACAGPVVYYAVRQPGYAHPFATFWAAWLVDAWDASFDGSAEPRRLKTWLGLGALIGLAALARPQLALWAVLLAVAAADDLRRGWRAAPPGERGGGIGRALRVSAPRWALGAAVSLVAVSPQFLAWKALYGHFYLVPQGPGFLRWDAPAWSEVLFSSRNGLFPWAPLYAVAAIGLVVALRRFPRLGAGLCAGVALQTLANGAAWDWWAGGSFGGRRFDSCYVAFAFGLAVLVTWPPLRRRGMRIVRAVVLAAVTATAAIAVAGNLSLAAVSSAPTVPIHGGRPASTAIRRLVPGWLGRADAVMSSVANLPARAAFAWRYGVPLSSYDYVVGKNQLGELYPGLNSFRGKTRATLRLAHPDRHWMTGVAVGPGCVRVVGHHATLLVSFNRIGPVTVSLRAAAPAGVARAAITLGYRDRTLARGRVGRTPHIVSGVIGAIGRGTNVIAVDAPPGTCLYSVTFTAPRMRLGRRQAHPVARRRGR